jgi:hypothetical protein
VCSLNNLRLERATIKNHGLIPVGQQVHLKSHQWSSWAQRRIKVGLDQVLEGNRKEIGHKRDWVLQVVLMAAQAQEINIKHNQREQF